MLVGAHTRACVAIIPHFRREVGRVPPTFEGEGGFWVPSRGTLVSEWPEERRDL